MVSAWVAGCLEPAVGKGASVFLILSETEMVCHRVGWANRKSLPGGSINASSDQSGWQLALLGDTTWRLGLGWGGGCSGIHLAFLQLEEWLGLGQSLLSYFSLASLGHFRNQIYLTSPQPWEVIEYPNTGSSVDR